MAGAASPLLLRLLRPGEPENDEEEEATTAPGRRRLLPRCSPTPRPRSPQEEADEAAGPEASAGPRRVRFADALGLPLLELRKFCPEAEPEPGPAALPVPCLEFSLPVSEQQLLERLETGAALELESLGPCSTAEEEGEPPALRGLVRVRNLSYSKMVVVRASWDGWVSFRDHPARYVPGSSDGVTDRFAFCLPCVGRRLEFVLRYETPNEVFWANNQGHNYGVLLLPGTGEGILPPPTCPTVPALKSCLKPPRSRSDEPFGIENGSDSSGWDDLSKLPKPSPLKAEHVMQVPELMVTGTSLEKNDFDRDQSVTFPKCNLPMDTEIKTCAADQSKLPTTLEMEQEAGEVTSTVSENGAFREIKERKEEPGVNKNMSVNREADVGLHTQAQFHERLAQVQHEQSYLGLSHVLPVAGEYDSEDLVVEEEMEQLYLSHLNRLRAEEELKSSIGSGPEDEGILLLRASLQSAYGGPARPRNSLLVEEISQHYTNGEGGLSDEAEPEESMRVPPSSDKLLCCPGEEEGEVIPGSDLSPHPMEDLSLDKDWIPVSDGNYTEGLEKVPLFLEKECNGDEPGRGTVTESPHEGAGWDLSKEEDTMDIALPKTDASAALLVFPFNVANEGEDVMSFPETRDNIGGDIQMVIPVIGIQEQAMDISTGTTAWENSGSFSSIHKMGTVEMSPTTVQGETMLVLDSSPALAAALSLAFRFLCVLVFLPALLDSCTSLMAALLHLMSAWFL
ncbi:protein phosphatase 1 regulatory subunit 3F [Microcaecilia unicolor]|uniref:Protein phosphatase 1 regulatory subunit 3F n=1 Tax=Microcaecilia unicolor TaxID=1415580 RepID=A0A6P7X2T6_9AMPH|nr:protein phosphatase 1 regulatory subunit 3F [Microcaecilia unicolor]